MGGKKDYVYEGKQCPKCGSSCTSLGWKNVGVLSCVAFKCKKCKHPFYDYPEDLS